MRSHCIRPQTLLQSGLCLQSSRVVQPRSARCLSSPGFETLGRSYRCHYFPSPCLACLPQARVSSTPILVAHHAHARAISQFMPPRALATQCVYTFHHLNFPSRILAPHMELVE
ncbi:hypothetical protein K438DRAFT_1805182 [Mycena galopus ATCC 62051]|nr:hypothetical protein K438DRAFT_1805182 [Mycena galopus ATCC 62051]